MMRKYFPNHSLEVVRGDERLQPNTSGLSTRWMCPVHGHPRIVNVLRLGEVYPACQACIVGSPQIMCDTAMEAPK